MIFEFGGPRVYSYEQFLRAVAHQAGLAPLLVPIPFAVWHALAWASEILPGPLLTRNQVELMQIDTVSSPEMPGFVELGDFAALGRGNSPKDVIELRMKEAPRLIRFNG